MKAPIRTRIALALANVAAKLASPGIIKRFSQTLSGVDDSRGGWWPLLRHLNFQTDNVVVKQDLVMAQWTVFSCMTLIASDIGKLCLNLVEKDTNGIWMIVSSPAFSPVLRKPNRFQTMQKFIEQWILSLLSNGNAYILKVRDARKVVIEMYVLDPCRVRPLVAPDGSVYYALQEDELSKVKEYLEAVPSSEIIHDRINCIFHPLVGVSPIFACGLAATKALKIEENASRFFANQSQPGGILTAPEEIGDEDAKRLKEYFEAEFTGQNAGRVAVLGNGLTYTPMTTNAVDAQLVEQLKMSAEAICAVFHVPAYMVGAAPVPPNNNVEALQIKYFGQCLQTLIRGIEDGLDEGLGLPDVQGKVLGTMFDLDDLLRMDTTALTAALKDQVGAGITKINEARRRLNLGPVVGGDTCYLQQQNYSLLALNKRDQMEDPFGTAKPAPSLGPDVEPTEDEVARADAANAKESADEAKAVVAMLTRKIAELEASKTVDSQQAFMSQMFDKMAGTFGVKNESEEEFDLLMSSIKDGFDAAEIIEA